MWETIGRWVAQKFIQSEIQKLSGNDKTLAEKAFSDFIAGQNLKKEAATYLDGVLAEGQAMSADKINDWFMQKRAMLKAWAGQ